MRAPDKVVGEKYLHRWWLIPRNKYFNIYLHKFTGSDDDRALHDHPWWSISFCLKGKLSEIHETHYMTWPWPEYLTSTRCIKRFLPHFRKATHMHRMCLESEEAWTIFITGPKTRDWGFRQVGEPNDWMHHAEFITKHGE